VRQSEERHGVYEQAGPKHHWSVWYGAYIVARQRGSTADDAAKEGTRQVENAVQSSL